VVEVELPLLVEAAEEAAEEAAAEEAAVELPLGAPAVLAAGDIAPLARAPPVPVRKAKAQEPSEIVL
jgi:hypothetical protein